MHEIKNITQGIIIVLSLFFRDFHRLFWKQNKNVKMYI